MLESSSVLKDINYKKTLLTRTLMYEESVGNKENKKILRKINESQYSRRMFG